MFPDKEHLWWFLLFYSLDWHDWYSFRHQHLKKKFEVCFFVALTELRQHGKRAIELYAQSESVALGFSLTSALNQLSKASPRNETPSISLQAWDRHLAVPLRDRGGHRHLPAAVLPSGKIPDAAPMLDWKEKHPIDKQTTRTNGEGFTKKDKVHFLTDQCDWNRIRRKVFSRSEWFQHFLEIFCHHEDFLKCK